MKREEAIEYGKEWLKDEYLDAKDGAFITIALEALEQQPFINKPCISEGVCREDKNKVLDKIRAEIERLQKMCDKDDLNLLAQYSAFGMVLEIIDKYKAESEVNNG